MSRQATFLLPLAILGWALAPHFGRALAPDRGNVFGDELVSSVQLGTPEHIEGECPWNAPAWPIVDTNKYPSNGSYSCPNGNHGNLEAWPQPLVATGELLCTFGVRWCPPVFSSPTTSSDAQGPFAMVEVTERQVFSCDPGERTEFKARTFAIYDTSDECRTPLCQEDGAWCELPEECCSYVCGDSSRTCGQPTPILVTLEGRAELSAVSDGVMFDFYGNNRPFLVPWPVQGMSFWLVLDRNGNGVIDDAGEMIGNRTALPDGSMAANGFLALASLDGNGDGAIDSSDAAFGQLRLWRDVVRDGISQPAELLALPDLQIVGLSTEYREARRRDRWGNTFRYRAFVFLASGERRFAYDVFLVQ